MSNVVTLASLLLLLGGFLYFRPPLLGGDTTYVMVSGISMEPAMHTGDLALAWRQDSYTVGDVVAFRVEEGGLVIHRIIGGSGESGYLVQGDNNDWVDQWRPTADQVAGKALVFIPRLGALFSYLQSPLRLAIVVGVIFLYISLAGLFLAYRPWGSRERRSQRRHRAPGSRPARG